MAQTVGLATSCAESKQHPDKMDISPSSLQESKSKGMDKQSATHSQELDSAAMEPRGLGITGANPEHHQDSTDVSSSSSQESGSGKGQDRQNATSPGGDQAKDITPTTHPVSATAEHEAWMKNIARGQLGGLAAAYNAGSRMMTGTRYAEPLTGARPVGNRTALSQQSQKIAPVPIEMSKEEFNRVMAALEGTSHNSCYTPGKTSTSAMSNH